jgi:hypothetical protein
MTLRELSASFIQNTEKRFRPFPSENRNFSVSVLNASAASPEKVLLVILRLVRNRSNPT